MASTPDAAGPPHHPSSSVGSTMDSGSHDSDRPRQSRRDRSESRESSPGPLLIYRDEDLAEYLREERLRAANNAADQGNAVSSLNHDICASDNGEGEDMTEEEFFAQLGEGVPEWAKEPANVEPEVQNSGSTDLLEEDLEAQLEAELAAGDDNDPMELCEEDLEAQLNAELEAETHQEAAEAARRKANLEEALRIAAEKAALAAQYDQSEDLDTGGAAEDLITDDTAEDLDTDSSDGDPLDRLDDKVTAMLELEARVNKPTSKCYSRKRHDKSPKKRARKTKTTPTPPEARVGSSPPPPMRRTDELPQMYHHGEINWDLLMRHMTLNTRVELNHCYKSLGLDIERGKAVYENLKAYLRIPGNSVDLCAKVVDHESAKKIIAGIAHKLLIDQRWGETYFNRPSMAAGFKFVHFDADSTEVFLEFTSLVYKAMKLEEKRKKGKAKQQEDKAAREVVQHPTSQAFASTTYSSPRAVVQPLPSQAPIIIADNSPPVAAQQTRSQASTHNAINLPHGVSQPSPSQAPPNNVNNSSRTSMQQAKSKPRKTAQKTVPHGTMPQPQPQACADAVANSSHVVSQQQQQQPPPQAPTNAAKNHRRIATQQAQPQAQQQAPHNAANNPPSVAMQQPQPPTGAASNPTRAAVQQPQSQLHSNAQNNVHRTAVRQPQQQPQRPANPPANPPGNPPHGAAEQRHPRVPANAANHPDRGGPRTPRAQAFMNGAFVGPCSVTARTLLTQAPIKGMVNAPRFVARPRPTPHATGSAARNSPLASPMCPAETAMM